MTKKKLRRVFADVCRALGLDEYTHPSNVFDRIARMRDRLGNYELSVRALNATIGDAWTVILYRGIDRDGKDRGITLAEAIQLCFRRSDADVFASSNTAVREAWAELAPAGFGPNCNLSLSACIRSLVDGHTKRQAERIATADAMQQLSERAAVAEGHVRDAWSVLAANSFDSDGDDVGISLAEAIRKRLDGRIDRGRVEAHRDAAIDHAWNVLDGFCIARGPSLAAGIQTLIERLHPERSREAWEALSQAGVQYDAETNTPMSIADGIRELVARHVEASAELAAPLTPLREALTKAGFPVTTLASVVAAIGMLSKSDRERQEFQRQLLSAELGLEAYERDLQAIEELATRRVAGDVVNASTHPAYRAVQNLRQSMLEAIGSMCTELAKLRKDLDAKEAKP